MKLNQGKPLKSTYCYNSFSSESDYKNHKLTCHGDITSLKIETDEGADTDVLFLECGTTMKEEIKQETLIDNDVTYNEDTDIDTSIKNQENDESNTADILDDQFTDIIQNLKLEIKEEALDPLDDFGDDNHEFF